MSYHGVAQDEDGQAWVARLHQVNVLQGVSDEKLEVFDVHPVSFTLTMANCVGNKGRKMTETMNWEYQRRTRHFQLRLNPSLTGKPFQLVHISHI